ncbi:MAG: hypothetical protein AAF085_10420, partial [Planctomycetota bacterium]
ADLNGDGQIDTQFGGQSSSADAPVYWYDTLSRNPVIATNLFVWARPGNGIPPLAINTANQNAFVFRVDDNTPFTDTTSPVSSWPYLIRIRYRLHDTRGRLTSNYNPALFDDLDNNGDGNTDEVNEDQISGRWFERIINVPRP